MIKLKGFMRQRRYLFNTRIRGSPDGASLQRHLNYYKRVAALRQNTLCTICEYTFELILPNSIKRSLHKMLAKHIFKDFVRNRKMPFYISDEVPRNAAGLKIATPGSASLVGASATKSP